jgi:hypothetical protein
MGLILDQLDACSNHHYQLIRLPFASTPPLIPLPQRKGGGGGVGGGGWGSSQMPMDSR